MAKAKKEIVKEEDCFLKFEAHFGEDGLIKKDGLVMELNNLTKNQLAAFLVAIIKDCELQKHVMFSLLEENGKKNKKK